MSSIYLLLPQKRMKGIVGSIHPLTPPGAAWNLIIGQNQSLPEVFSAG
jgi:hypothetical protein